MEILQLPVATMSHVESSFTLPQSPSAPAAPSLAGFRMTAQRKVILRLLEESAGKHLDAATLLEKARKEVEIDRATVYRTLDLLKKRGLIDELDLMHIEGEKHYFEARTRGAHIHLACLGCGAIREVELDLYQKLQQKISRLEGFRIETARLEIGGYCAKCQPSEGQKEAISGEKRAFFGSKTGDFEAKTGDF